MIVSEIKGKLLIYISDPQAFWAIGPNKLNLNESNTLVIWLKKTRLRFMFTGHDDKSVWEPKNNVWEKLIEVRIDVGVVYSRIIFIW